MELQIVTNIGTYAYKGRLFERLTNTGKTKTHTVDDDLGQALLDTKNSPFRQLDDDGEIIPNESDLVEEKTKADSTASRTVLSESAKRKLAKDAADAEASEKGDISLDDLKPAPEPDAEETTDDAEPEPTPAPKPRRGRAGKKKAAASKAKATEGNVTIEKDGDDSTDGAVEG